jgi:hypothetical protein
MLFIEINTQLCANFNYFFNTYPHIMKNLILLLPLLLLFVSCEDRNAVKALQLETEKIHDDAMREMADMNRIARNLKKDPAFLVENTQKNARKDSILLILHQIELAENGMMSWMTGYIEPDEKMKITEAVAYLTEQRANILHNQKDINEAVLAGKRLMIND